MEITFAYPHWLILMSAGFPLFLLLQWKFAAVKTYKYALTHFLLTNLPRTSNWASKFLWLLRVLLLTVAIVFIARPQWSEKTSNVKVFGIDIVLAIDVSQSMELFDDLRDRRNRITVAKQQALNFIKNRLDDQIGIVIFGKSSLTLSPLTVDKIMLENVISMLNMGDVDGNATNLAEGLALAVARLNNSTAKSKIVILLTDGRPNNQSTVTMEKAVQLARDLGVKVYTIGIGNEDGGYVELAPGYIQPVRDIGADSVLLEQIAKATGGRNFNARNPQEIEDAYQRIDQLEKVERTTNQYYNHSDIFWPFMGTLLAMLFAQYALQAFVWGGLW